MLKVERFINELMTSNCYVVWDEDSHHCIVIDPASVKSLREIDFIESHDLTLDYILLTHEHTDHTWGVNALLDKYPITKVISTEATKKALPKAGNMYFRLYYDREGYTYEVRRIDQTTEELGDIMKWDGYDIKFIPSPGHSAGSVCIEIDGMLFSGDTIMQYKPYINKKSGSWEVYKETVARLLDMFDGSTMVYPGHGEVFAMKDYDNLCR